MRVDERRWDLRLKDGSLIQLPAVEQDAALIQLDAAGPARSGCWSSASSASTCATRRWSRVRRASAAAPDAPPPTAERGLRSDVRLRRDVGEAEADVARRRDGLKAALARRPWSPRVDLGAVQGRLFHHEARGRAPRRPHPDHSRASAMSSRAACAAAPSSIWTRRPRPSPRRSSGPRPWPASPSQGVTVATAGGQLASHRVQARVSLGARPIGDDDLARAIGMALAQIRMPGRRAIHLLPIAWSVDGAGRRARSARHVRPHAGPRTAGRLDGRERVPHPGPLRRARPPAARGRRRRALRLRAGRAGRGRDGPGLRLHRHGRRLDLGRGLRRAARLLHVESLRVGGNHVTADIARGLSTSMAGAERIKTLHGSAIASANEDREMIEAPPRGEDPAAGPVIAPRSMLKGIIAPRVEETLELLRDRLKRRRRGHRARRGPGPDRRRQPAGRRARSWPSGCSTARCAWAVPAARRTWPTPPPARPSARRPACCTAPPSARARRSRPAS